MSDDLVVCQAARNWSHFFRGQAVHGLFLVAMLPAAWALAAPAASDERFLGLTDMGWLGVCVGGAIAHQMFVWLAWRSQIGWQALTTLLGRNDFSVFCAVFFPLLVSRPLLVLAVAWVDHGSLELPVEVAFLTGGFLLLPAAATGYSVAKYFGMARAAGGDHFRETYRRMPFVKQGAFCWTDNAMYTLAFFGLWSIAFLLRSHVALVAAVFQHGYIWVHYVATEKPDIELIYADVAE